MTCIGAVAASDAKGAEVTIQPVQTSARDGLYYVNDDISFMIVHEQSLIELRFVGDDEIYYLASEPASLGGRTLKDDTGDTILAVSTWGSVTLYTAQAPSGIPADRIGDIENFAPDAIGADQSQTFAKKLTQSLLDRGNLTVDFAADWNALTKNEMTRQLACDAMRNANAALQEAVEASQKNRDRISAKIKTVRAVASTAPRVALQNGALIITFAPSQGKAGRPSSRAIARVIEKAI
jgi:hypothetical protein